MAERVGFEPTLGFPKHAFQACAFSRSATSPVSFQQRLNDYLLMAERPGFEPGVELPPQQFSRLPPSATRPPLRFNFELEISDFVQQSAILDVLSFSKNR